MNNNKSKFWDKVGAYVMSFFNLFLAVFSIMFLCFLSPTFMAKAFHGSHYLSPFFPLSFLIFITILSDLSFSIFIIFLYLDSWHGKTQSHCVCEGLVSVVPMLSDVSSYMLSQYKFHLGLKFNIIYLNQSSFSDDLNNLKIKKSIENKGNSSQSINTIPISIKSRQIRNTERGEGL